MTREEIVKLGNEAIEKAKNDPEFKKKLISDGNKAVLELTGKELPIKLTVHDTDEKRLVFILPEILSGELDESDLSEVSGGFAWPLDKESFIRKFLKGKSPDLSSLMAPTRRVDICAYSMYPGRSLDSLTSSFNGRGGNRNGYGINLQQNRGKSR